MEPNEPRLPAIPDGRSPADLTKKELVAHLTAVLNTPAQQLNALTRDGLLALFDMPFDEALAAVNARPRGCPKRRSQPPKPEEKPPVYEHFLTGRVGRK